MEWFDVILAELAQIRMHMLIKNAHRSSDYYMIQLLVAKTLL